MNNVISIEPTRVTTNERPRMARVVYTVAEVAELLGLSVTNVYTLLRAGRIPAKRIGARWIISRQRLHAWMDEPSTPGDDRDIERDLARVYGRP